MESELVSKEPKKKICCYVATALDPYRGYGNSSF